MITLDVLSTRLPGSFHADPSDRLIVATSLVHKAALVTKDQKVAKDQKITDWGFVPIEW